MVAGGIRSQQASPEAEGLAKEDTNERGKVCVTGGGGFVASWLIMKLLARGYSVRATVRSDPKFEEETGHLISLPGAPDNLEICDADLTRPESFVPAVAGCVGVFHVATPTDHDAEDYDRKAATVAVEGVLGVLRACATSGTVRRVVYTSSAGAVLWSRGGGGGGEEAVAGGGRVVLDESAWTDVEYLRGARQGMPLSAYMASKTLAERAALDFAAEHGLDLVTVLPACVVGPFLVPYQPSSVAVALDLLRGDGYYCELLENMQYVHVDDVAAAHVFLLECPEARGRYLCSAADTTIHSLARFLRARFPEFPIPDGLVGEGDDREEPALGLSSKKLQSLGFKFKYGLEEMFDGAIHAASRRAFFSFQRKTGEESVRCGSDLKNKVQVGFSFVKSILDSRSIRKNLSGNRRCRRSSIYIYVHPMRVA